jgi:hypothetical protein
MHAAHWTALALLLAPSAGARDFSFKAFHEAKGFHWLSDRSPGFDYYFEPNTPAARDIEKIKGIMENTRKDIETLLGVSVGQRVGVFIVDSRARMKDLAGAESNGFAANGIQAVVYNDTISAIGAHETCHLLAAAAWGRPSAQWITEGLAVYSDDEWWGLPLHSVARGLMDHKDLVPMKDLTRKGRINKYPDWQTYPELGSFVKFIYETQGRDAIVEMWRHGAPRDLRDMEIQWLGEVAKAEPKYPDYYRTKN